MDASTPELIQGTEPATDVTDVTDVTPGVTEPEAEPVETDPDAPGDETPEPEPKPSGIDKRISRLVWEREQANRRAEEATRRAAYYEGLAQGGRGAPPQGAQPEAKDGPPKQEQFESYDEYLRALTRHEIRTEMAQERQKLTQDLEAREIRGTFESRAQAVREKHSDFDEVVFNENLSVSVPMRDAFMNLPDGAELAYHLGQHPEEAARISRLSPNHQMLELGRISYQLATPPPPPAPKPQVSAAPAPITPVKAAAKATEALRDDLSVAEWMRRRGKDLRGTR
jgi:hypothetical protein